MYGCWKGYWLLSASKWLNSGCRGRIAQSLHPVWHKVKSVNFHTWVLHFHTQAVIILGVLFNTLQIAQASKWGLVSSWHQQASLACMATVHCTWPFWKEKTHCVCQVLSSLLWSSRSLFQGISGSCGLLVSILQHTVFSYLFMKLGILTCHLFQSNFLCVFPPSGKHLFVELIVLTSEIGRFVIWKKKPKTNSPCFWGELQHKLLTGKAEEQ